jgi:Protein of unknown function (DUF3995)
VAAPVDREPTSRRIAGTISSWLGTRTTWPAYGAAGITAAYGMLKAYWVFGGTALWSVAPLSEDMIEKARSHTAPRWFEIADAATVVLAVAGVAFALATVRPRRWLPVWLERWSLWPLATLMVLRAVLATAGDVQQVLRRILHQTTPPATAVHPQARSIKALARESTIRQSHQST